MQNLDPKSLWHRKGLILSLTLGAMAAGGLYSTTARKVYQSEARVVVVRQQNPAAVRPLATERYFLATQAEIMGSPLIVERAIERLSRPVGRPTAELLEDVRITPMDDTDVLTVVVRDSDPRTAAELVDAIVESFADYTRDVDQKRTGSTVAAMVQRERELSQAIDEAQAEYTRVRAESPLVGSSGDGIQIPLARLRQISDELATVTAQSLQLGTQIKLAAAGGRTPVGRPDATDFQLTTKHQATAPYSDDLQTTHILDDLRAAQSDYTSLARQYAENHPLVSAAGEKVRGLQRELEDHNRQVVDRLEQAHAATLALREELQSEYDALVKQTKAMDSFIVREETLQTKLQRLSETHQSLLTTLSQVRLAENELNSGSGSVEVRLLDGSDRISEAVWPRPSLILSLAGILGLGLGCLLAVFLEPAAVATGESFAAAPGRLPQAQVNG